MARKEGVVMPVVDGASLDTFPNGFAEVIAATSSPQSIFLFLEYQEQMKLVSISMHEEVGDWRRGKGSISARRLMLTDIKENATVSCDLKSDVSNALVWKYGGATSITIRPGVGHGECPYIDEDMIIRGAVSSKPLT